MNPSPAPAPPDAESPGSPVPRWVLLLSLLTLLAIPARVISYGYLPADDALRHAAKAVSGKSWADILVLGPHYTVDHNFGWEALLRRVHQATGWDAERLVDLSVLGLFLVAAGSALPWLKRPEAWLGTLLLFFVAWPPLAGRWMLGRPLLLSLGVLISLLFLVQDGNGARPARGKVAAMTALIALAVFTHGVWYLWLLPVLACFLARAHRPALALAAAWAAGAVLGAVFTGRPVDYLVEAVRTALRATQLHPTARTLVPELQPVSGGLVLFLAWGGLLVLRRLARLEARPLTRLPAFWLAGLGWTLGFLNRRVWEDWGLPALLVLVAAHLDFYLRGVLAAAAPRRLAVTAGLAAALFCVTTSDLDSRWTRGLTRQYLTRDDPALAGWLPEPSGIFYAADPAFFYETFFKNPRADWRYILGFEMTLMPPEDFQILYRILWNFGAAASYRPWVDKLRPQDRLFVRSDPGAPPPIPGLEWHHTLGGMWSGRLPRRP